MKKYICTRKILGILLLGILFFFAGKHNIFAAASLYLSPNSGVIDADGSTLSLSFNSDGKTESGASVVINFTGSVEYVSSKSTVCDQQFEVVKGTNSVAVLCLFKDAKVSTGKIATLVFKSKASSGTSVFTLSNPDPDGASVTGGTYRLVSTSSGGTSLPGTAIFDSSVILSVGFILIISGVGIFMYSKRKEKILLENEAREYEEFLKSPKMKDKLKG